MELKVEKQKESKIQVTGVISPDQRKKAEEEALVRLATQVEIKGFRVGKAPADKVRERVGQERLLEETVRVLLPDFMKEALKQSDAKPILRPAVSIMKTDPLTLAIIFVNRPPVSVKKPDSIKVEKKELKDASDAEVDTFINKVLASDRTETPVEREVKKGDAVRVELSANKKGKPVEELTVPNFSLLIGSEEILPELEPHLIGMKKDEKKKVDISFPKDHDIPALKGEKVSVEMTVKGVSDVKIPELTADYIKTRLKADRTPEQMRDDVKKMLTQRKRDEEMKRREDEFYDKVRTATSVDLASELVEQEVQEMVRDLHERLKQQGTDVENWLKMTGKDEKTVVAEMREIAKSRLTLRFGMQELAEQLKLEVPADQLDAALKAAAKHGYSDGSPLPEKELQPGGNVYENIKHELRMQTLRDKMVLDEGTMVKAA